MWFYRVYGLRLQSKIAIPGLRPTEGQETGDIQVCFGRLPEWVGQTSWESRPLWRLSGCDDGSDDPGLKVSRSLDRASFRLSYPDGTQFVVSDSGGHVWATWPDSLTLEDTATYLLGPILGFVLALRGVPCLHASAVVLNRRAVLLAGAAGAGKSTTAAAFARLGYPVLTEDVSPLHDRDGRIDVQPGYPLIRLWPASVQALYGAADALPLITPNWDKRYLKLADSGRQFQTRPLPLGAVYVLEKRSDDVHAPSVNVLPPAQGLLALVGNSYATRLLDSDMRAREFEVFGRVAARVPLRQVYPHADPSRLPQLCEAIIRDFEKIPPAA
jgi:hypothetical protein